MNFSIHRATKASARLRLGLIGPSGSGKTYSALNLAKYLGKKVCLIDTERRSASKYADIFTFDVLELESFAPDVYVEALKAVADAGYDLCIVDSLSHAWMGKDGALEQVDKFAKRSQSGNSFAAWREVTPMHNRLVDAILSAPMHVIATVRSKTEWVLEENDRGKKVPRKVGMAPVQRDGLEYEFDVTSDMTLDNDMVISKTRCPAMAGKVFNKPGKEVAAILSSWLVGSTPESVPASATQAPSTPPPMHNGGESSALWSKFSESLSQAPDLAALKVVSATIKASADAQKLTLTQVANLRDLAKARQKAIKAGKSVEEVMAEAGVGNLPESWGGPKEPTNDAMEPVACHFCKQDATDDHVEHTTGDGEVVWRHPDCNAFSHR